MKRRGAGSLLATVAGIAALGTSVVACAPSAPKGSKKGAVVSDVANAAGSPKRTAEGAPMPSVPAGALIGRIGPSGEPFAIGNLTSVAMPGSGRLFLMVNDDELSDNGGGYEVILTPGMR